MPCFSRKDQGDSQIQSGGGVTFGTDVELLVDSSYDKVCGTSIASALSESVAMIDSWVREASVTIPSELEHTQWQPNSGNRSIHLLS